MNIIGRTYVFNQEMHKHALNWKEIGLRLQILIITLHTIMNIIGRTYVFNQEMHKHALPITITKLEEVCFGIWFWHMFNYRFANQCKFCGVNFIGRSRRKGETNQISATYLRWYRPSLRDFIDNYVELELARLLCLLMII